MDVVVPFAGGTASDTEGQNGILVLDGPDAVAGTTIQVKDCRVGNGQQYNTSLEYNFGAISVNYQSGKKALAAGAGNKATDRYYVEDFTANAWSGKTLFSYVYAPAVNHIALPKYFYCVGTTGTPAVPDVKSSTDWIINYSDNKFQPKYVTTAATGAWVVNKIDFVADASSINTFSAPAVTAGINVAPLPATITAAEFAKFNIAVTNDVVTLATTPWSLAAYNNTLSDGPLVTAASGNYNYYNFHVKGNTSYRFDAKFTSNSTGKEDYYNADITSAGVLTLDKILGVPAPTADVPSTLTITACDVFGHKIVIAELPITIKH